MYSKVSTDMNYTQREAEITKLWKEKDIQRRSYDLRKEGDRFTFYDGPPTANGRPHIGHV